MAQGSFGIKVEGLDSLVRAADKMGGELPKMLYTQMVRNMTKLAKDAARVGPDRFKNQTGNLRRSIASGVSVESASRGVLRVGEKYGFWVETGTAPHVILPKKKKMLAFKVNGRWVFAKRVRHPGTKAYPFMEPTFRENIDPILREYADIADYIVKGMAT